MCAYSSSSNLGRTPTRAFASAAAASTALFLCCCTTLTSGFVHGGLPHTPAVTRSSRGGIKAAPATSPAQTSTSLAAWNMFSGDEEEDNRPMLDRLLNINTCESDIECPPGQSCCSFGFISMCCNDGERRQSEQLVPVLIPVPVDPYYGQGAYGGRGGQYGGGHY